MTYAILMVHLELGHSNAGLLRIAGDLAVRFHASVIGIAACRPMQMMYADGYVSGDVMEQDRADMASQLKAAEAEFRSILQERVPVIEWRSTTAYVSLADYLAREARSADLVITGVISGAFLDGSRAMNTSDLVMQVGRPVLIVPAAADTLKLERVIVCWKDTGETRRAIADALPLLKLAAHVTVVEMAAAADLAEARARLADVAGWLKRHGVEAESLAALSTGDDATGLYTITQQLRADVVVAGAYGHSRLREWVLSGVTRDLLLSGDRCALVSH